jgi:hypothetical protein
MKNIESLVEKINGDMALVGGGWRGIERYEVMERSTVDDVDAPTEDQLAKIKEQDLI